MKKNRFTHLILSLVTLIVFVATFPSCGKAPESTLLVEQVSAEEEAQLDPHSILANSEVESDATSENNGDGKISTADIVVSEGVIVFEAALKAQSSKGKKKDACAKSLERSKGNVTGRCESRGGSMGTVKAYSCKCSGSKLVTCKAPASVECTLPVEGAL